MGNEDNLRIEDLEGIERDWNWLVSEFGAIQLERVKLDAAQRKAYRLVRLEVADGPAAQIVNVVGLDGRPLEGVHVVRSWPEAPDLPEWAVHASAPRRQGVYGPTNTEGNLGFGLGRSERYKPPSAGAGAIWVADKTVASDLIAGLGMLDETEHRHVNLFFQLADVDAKVPVPTQLPDRRIFGQAPDSTSTEPNPKRLSGAGPAARSPSPEPTSGTPSGTSTSPPPAPPSPAEDAWTAILNKLDLIANLIEERLNE